MLTVWNSARGHLCGRYPGKDSGCTVCPESWSEAEFEGNELTHLQEEVSDRSVSKLWHGCYLLLTGLQWETVKTGAERTGREGRYVQFQVSDKEGAGDETFVIVKNIRNIKEKCSVWDSWKDSVRVRPYPSRLCLVEMLNSGCCLMGSLTFKTPVPENVL